MAKESKPKTKVRAHLTQGVSFAFPASMQQMSFWLSCPQALQEQEEAHPQEKVRKRWRGRRMQMKFYIWFDKFAKEVEHIPICYRFSFHIEGENWKFDFLKTQFI